MLSLNERVTSIDTPLGPNSDKSVLETVADDPKLRPLFQLTKQ